MGKSLEMLTNTIGDTVDLLTVSEAKNPSRFWVFLFKLFIDYR